MASIAFGPPTAVVSGDAIRASDADYLTEAGLLLEGEEILYFYSIGFFSIRGYGVFASNLGVTSYWTDLGTDDLAVAYLAYSEIEDIEVTYSSSPLEDTEVRMEGPGEENWFVFFLSPEDGGDRLFLEEVERRRPDDSRSQVDPLFLVPPLQGDSLR